MAEGSDLEVEHKMRTYLEALQERSGLDKGQVENIDRGIRRVVEARRRDTEKEISKKVRFGEEEQTEEFRMKSTDQRNMMNGLGEVRTGRASAGLVRGEMSSVGRTGPPEKAEEKVTWRKENMGAKEHSRTQGR